MSMVVSFERRKTLFNLCSRDQSKWSQRHAKWLKVVLHTCLTTSHVKIKNESKGSPLTCTCSQWVYVTMTILFFTEKYDCFSLQSMLSVLYSWEADVENSFPNIWYWVEAGIINKRIDNDTYVSRKANTNEITPLVSQQSYLQVKYTVINAWCPQMWLLK